jgi:hypothetical protein
VIRTRTVAATPFWNTGFVIGLPLPSTNVIVADGFVVAQSAPAGCRSARQLSPAVFVNVCISHSAALPLWLAAGVVARHVDRAQSTISVARPVPDTSWTSIVRFV